MCNNEVFSFKVSWTAISLRFCPEFMDNLKPKTVGLDFRRSIWIAQEIATLEFD